MLVSIVKAAALSLTVTAVAALTASSQGPPYIVKWVGAQRDLMRGDLSSHIALDSLAGVAHLYALGPLEQLQGEITIWDGRPTVARIQSERIVIDTTFNHRAAFLVWVAVDRWRTVPMPAISDMAGLEKFVVAAAKNAKLDLGQPFPFLISGQAEQVNFHVLDKRDGQPHAPALHERAKVRFTLEKASVQIVGFYSDSHQGTFIPQDRVVHMHLRTPDQRMGGHVDELRIAGDAALRLPRMR